MIVIYAQISTILLACIIILFIAEEYGSFMHHVNFSRYCVLYISMHTENVLHDLNGKCELNSYFIFSFLNSPFVRERGSLEYLSQSLDD